MGEPVIRRTTKGKTKTNLERLMKKFIEVRVNPEINRVVNFFDKKWDKPENLMEFRQMLRDEVRRALDPQNDPAYGLSNQAPKTRGHEARIALLAAVIVHLIDEDLRTVMEDLWR